VTKSKPVAPKPIRVWTLCDDTGEILTGDLGSSRNYLRWLAGQGWNPPRRVIRVEIRPAPKRRKGAKP
jgi:hypothetical protein